jgi:hypothetical protein
LASLVEWIEKGKYVKYWTVNLREDDKEDDQKRDGGTVYRQILINAHLKTGKRDQETELIGRSALRRGSSCWTVVAYRKKEEKRRRRRGRSRRRMRSRRKRRRK